jgi:hypothetical protein
MGGKNSKIKNIVNSFISSNLNVLTQASLNNKVIIDQYQGLNIEHTGGDVIITDIDWSQYTSANVEGVQQAVASTDVQNQIKQAVTQLSKQISQSFSFRIGDSSSEENITNLTTKLSTEIQNVFTTSCTSSILQNAVFNVKDTGGNVIIRFFKSKQVANSFVKCAQDSDTVNKAKNDLINEISQTAIMKEVGMFDWIADLFEKLGKLIVPIIIVMGLVFVKFVDKGIDVATDPKKIAGLIAAIFAISYFTKRTNTSKNDAKKCELCKKDKKDYDTKCKKEKSDAKAELDKCKKDKNNCDTLQKKFDDIKCEFVPSDLCKENC